MRKTPYIFALIILAANSEAAKKRVCIVGAGVSGLVAAKYLGEYPNDFEPIVFEKNSDVGGLWIYSNSTTYDRHGLPVHSSMYKDLKTNAVKEQMTFPDYPHFGGEGGKWNFVRREDVLQYLRNYTDHFKLRRYIKFNTNVENVKPLPKLRWQVQSQNLNTRRRDKVSCDAVILCNGYNVKEYMPKIVGIETFTGRVLHSHSYREPKVFANQTVVVLGASSSGVDVSVQISSVAEKVYLSHRRKKLPDVFPPNVEQVPEVVRVDGSELILSNGARIQADTMIFCTGYVYDFPFLDASSGIVVDEGKYIRPLYKQLINIERPTMALINVPEPGYHFQNPHAQMQYFRAVLLGKLKLPTREKMLMESQLPANVPKSKAHVLRSTYIVPYYNDLQLAAGGESLPWWYVPADDLLDVIIAKDPVHFRGKSLVKHDHDRTVEFI